jgi:SAM-dependent methyltransferase
VAARMRRIFGAMARPQRQRAGRRQFRASFDAFVAASGDPARFPIEWSAAEHQPGDDTEYTAFDEHYIYHPAWAARILARNPPAVHIDISSTLAFCSIVSAFVPVKFYDYRPARLSLSDLTSEKADLLALPFADRSVASLSCMHTVEHVGLGRYGDPLDPDGDLKAMAELTRVLAPGGNLLFVVPTGRPRVVFNAHRIYSFEQVRSSFSGLALQDFSLIPDDARTRGIIANASAEEADRQIYGCGCYWFRRT